MSDRTIKLDFNKGTFRITLNRPDKLNSFNVQMHTEFREALKQVENEESARVLVITGAGRAFSAGQDLNDRITGLGEKPTDLGDSIEFNYKPLTLALRNLQVPVIAAVNGVAAGAGANIALACDLVIASTSASFLQPFCKLGLVPDCGGTWSLPKLIGLPRGMGLALLGNKLLASDAAKWGLIWECVDDADFPQVIEKYVDYFAEAPTYGLGLIKKAIYAGFNNSLEDQLDLERDFQRELGFSQDYKEGVTAFKEKRKPIFSGRKK